MLSWYHSSATAIWNSVYWRRQWYAVNHCAGYVGHLHRVNGAQRHGKSSGRCWLELVFCFVFFRAVSMLFLILHLFIVCVFILFLVALGLHCWFMSPALAGRFLPTLPPGESLRWALKGTGGEVKERVEWAESVKAGRREVASFRAPTVRATWSPRSLKWVPVFVSPVPYAKIVAKTNVKKLFPYVFLQEFYGIPS